MRVAGHFVKLSMAFSLFVTGCVKYASDQPSITNEDVQTVYAASAITHCFLSGINGAYAITKFGQCWSSANDVPDYNINQGKTEFTDNKNGDYTSRLTGLFPKTTYYVRAYYISGSDTIYARQITLFTTKDTATQQPPNVATLAAFGVGTASFNITGSVISVGSSNVSSYGHCYSSSNAIPTIADAKNNLGALSSPQQYNSLFTSLTPHTTYYVRAYATNSVGTSYGNVVAVTTTANGPSISVIDPTSGPAGTRVTITGTNFDATAANDTVRFNGTVASVVSASATQIVVLAPANGKTGNVTVSTANGSANGPVFTYLTTGDIYVVGRSSFGPSYWKNGVRTSMPTNCLEANGIFVDGTDVYIAGADLNGPAYWKNGVDVSLPMANGHNGGRAESVFVSGTDVYVAGYDFTNGAYSLPRCWKNGQLLPVSLSTGNISAGLPVVIGYAYSVFVSGSDVYLAGSQSPSSGNQVATYWKNGNPVPLTDGSTVSEAKSVFVVGTNAYVAGYIQGSATTAYYWKNGTPVPLNIRSASFNCTPEAIYVTPAGDVYVSGELGGLAKYWKNGIMTDLTSATPVNGIYETAFSITGNGQDIYIAGLALGLGTGYWKNGTFNALPAAQNVYGIVVK